MRKLITGMCLFLGLMAPKLCGAVSFLTIEDVQFVCNHNKEPTWGKRCAENLQSEVTVVVVAPGLMSEEAAKKFTSAFRALIEKEAFQSFIFPGNLKIICPGSDSSNNDNAAAEACRMRLAQGHDVLIISEKLLTPEIRGLIEARIKAALERLAKK